MRHTTASAAECVRAFVLGRFPAARSRPLGNDDPLLASGIVDSLGVLDLVAYLEEEFAISVADDDLNAVTFRSVDSLASFVITRLENGVEDS